MTQPALTKLHSKRKSGILDVGEWSKVDNNSPNCQECKEKHQKMTFPMKQNSAAAFPASSVGCQGIFMQLWIFYHFIILMPYNWSSLSCNLKCPWWCFQLASSIKSYSILSTIIIFLDPILLCFINTWRVSALARCSEHRQRASHATCPPGPQDSDQRQAWICEVASCNDFDKYLYAYCPGHEIDISIRIFMHRLYSKSGPRGGLVTHRGPIYSLNIIAVSLWMFDTIVVPVKGVVLAVAGWWWWHGTRDIQHLIQGFTTYNSKHQR